MATAAAVATPAASARLPVDQADVNRLAASSGDAPGDAGRGATVVGVDAGAVVAEVGATVAEDGDVVAVVDPQAASTSVLSAVSTAAAGREPRGWSTSVSLADNGSGRAARRPATTVRRR